MGGAVVAVGHAPAVVVAYGLHDGETQAVAPAASPRAVEAVEDLPLVQGGGVRRVRHRQPPVRHLDGDRAAGAVVARRVHHQVVHQALQQRPVRPHHQGAAVERLAYPDIARRAPEEGHLPPQEAGQGYVLRLLELAVVYLGQQQQVPVEAGQPRGRVVEPLYQVGLPLGEPRLLQQQVQPGLEDGERGLQLVRRVLGELPLRAVARHAVAHQLPQHAVEPVELPHVRPRQVGHHALLQAEGLHAPQRLVERPPQPAGDEAQRHRDGHQQQQHDEGHVYRHALHYVLLQVERRDGPAHAHRLDEVDHVLGVEPLRQAIEQGRGQQQQRGRAGHELDKHLARQAPHGSTHL